MQKCQLLNEQEYREAQEQYRDTFVAGMGAEAIKILLSQIELSQLNVELEEAMNNTKSKQIRKKLAKRLKLVQGFMNSHSRPEWMILDVLPVIPAGSSSARSSGRWTVCYFGLERSLSTGHQPEQSAKEPAPAQDAGRHYSE